MSLRDDIRDRARKVDVGRHLIGLAISLPLALGFAAGMVLRGAAVMWAHVWAAAAVGFEKGRGT